MSNACPCPICAHTTLHSKTSHGIEVDVCVECSGIWFDAGEFDPLVAERFRGDQVESYFRETAKPPEECRNCRAQTRGAAVCSRCGEEMALCCPADGADMLVVRFAGLELDWCPGCHGIWIEGEERSQLADQDAPQLQDRVAGAGEDEWVFCGGCGNEAEKRRCIQRLDTYWCEACVLEGDYPGGHGPPVSRRLIEASRLMAEAEATLAGRKLRNSQIKRAREGGFGRVGGVRRHSGEAYFAIVDAIEVAARSLRNLFRKKNNDDRR